MDDKYDGLLLSIARDHEGIGPLLGTFLSFLRRKTDFFTGAPREQVERVFKDALDAQFALIPKKKAVPKNQGVSIEEIDTKGHLSAEAKAARAKKELEEARREQEESKRREEAEREEKRREKEEKKEKEKEKGKGKEKEGEDGDDGDSDDEEDEEDKGKMNPNSMNGGTTSTYLWGQTLGEVEVRVPLPAGTRAKQLKVTIKPRKLEVAMKESGEVIMGGDLAEPIKTEDSMWAIEDGSVLSFSLVKVNAMNWWSRVCTDETEINTRKIQPENSRLEDLDDDTAVTVRKMMVNQRRKEQGLPSIEEEEKQNMLKKFMESHPEMDFSNAKIQ